MVFLVMIMPFQASYGQSIPCPANYEKAEQELKEYLLEDGTIQRLSDHYNMPISNSAIDQIVSLSEKKNQQECQQLLSNATWLEDEENYSIYKVAAHYFIVIYSFDEKGSFQRNEIQILNSEYEFLGSVIDFG